MSECVARSAGKSSFQEQRAKVGAQNSRQLPTGENSTARRSFDLSLTSSQHRGCNGYSVLTRIQYRIRPPQHLLDSVRAASI